MVYTTAAKEAAGGKSSIEAEIDLMVAEANTAFSDSGAHLQLRLVHVEELDYVEPPDSSDLSRLRVSGDGYMDEVHALRDAVGADLVHLIEEWGVDSRSPYCGKAYIGPISAGAYAVTVRVCGSRTFAHEVGHNIGLLHDRYTACGDQCGSRSNHYNLGYVNQAMFQAGAPVSSRWYTLMAYSDQCAGRSDCMQVNRFSNPNQTYNGDPLGVPATPRPSPYVDGPADAVRALNENGQTVAGFRAPPTTPVVLSLKRLTAETTNADTLGWRLTFNMDVQNVTNDDFVLTGAGTPTLTVTAVSSQRVYDIEASGGNLAGLSATVTLGFASGQDITALDGTALRTTWHVATQRHYTLDNTAPQPTISPSSAGSATFTATVRFDEDVTGFDSAGDVTAPNASVAAPVRADTRTYTVQVTPDAGETSITVTVPADAAQDEVGNGNAVAEQVVTYDTTQARTLSLSGLANADTPENAVWTVSATVSGNPVGTVTWLTEGADADHFTLNASGALRLAAQDYENPADADAGNTYEVTVRAVDTRGNTAAQAITVTVTNVSGEVSGQGIIIAGDLKPLENFGFRRLMYLAKEPVGAVTWTGGGADLALFELSKFPFADREFYRLEMRTIPDYEQPADANTDNTYELILTATDDDSNTFAGRLEVTVRNRTRTLGITGLSNTWILKHTPYTATPVVTGHPIGTVRWTAGGADAHHFSIDPTTGELYMGAQDDAYPVDENQDNAYEVTVQVTDEEAHTATQPLTIRVVSSPPRPPPPPGGGGGGGGSRTPTDRHGDTPDAATSLMPRRYTTGVISRTINAHLQSRRDIDYFTLTLPRAGLLTASTTGADTTGRLYQAQDEGDPLLVAQDTDSGRGTNFRLGEAVEPGTYYLAVSAGRGSGDYRLSVHYTPAAVGNPAPDSFQSGVSVLSGWVCDADTVEIELVPASGDPQRWVPATGTSRPDTAGVCGAETTDTGYGLLYNWNRLGDGAHTVRVWMDDVLVDERQITVTTLGEHPEQEFRTDLHATTEVADFPAVGETTTLRWEQARQNFMIAGGAGGGTGQQLTPTQAQLGNPAPGSFQSGVGVVSGWMCDAERVEIAFETAAGTTFTEEAGYGTARPDTADVCGDTDNGFGLLVNWNRLGTGQHTVRAFADGEEFAHSTFTVTTLGAHVDEEFRRGLRKTHTIADFPAAGQTTTVEWQTGQQNFVIVGVTDGTDEE